MSVQSICSNDVLSNTRPAGCMWPVTGFQVALGALAFLAHGMKKVGNHCSNAM